MVGMSSSSSPLHSQLASIMEVLANAAVAEICQLVDEGFSGLRVEVSRCRRENLALKTRLRLMELRARPQDHRRPRSSSWARGDGGDGEQSSSSSKSSCLQSKLLDAVELEVSVREESLDVKTEAVLEESSGPSCRGGHGSLCPSAPLHPLQIQVLPAGGPHHLDQQTEALASLQEGRSLCGPSGEEVGAGVSDDSAAHLNAVEAELSMNSIDWSSAVKLEVVPCWSHSASGCEGDPSLNRSEQTDTKRLQTDGEAALMDAGSLDASFNHLFSSQEASLCLSAPHRASTGSDDPLLSSSFSFPASSGFSSASSRLSGSAERTFSCSHCSRLFSSSRDLLVHQRSHAGQRIYHCPLCRKPFVHPHQLKTHQRVHTGEKPFSCAQCGKRFSQSSHIKRHMSVHTGEKRYSCGLCGKRFSQACSLKVHQAVHTGDRPYCCTTCGKRFSVMGNLVRHQSIHVGK